jgi:hypothetical protein
MRRRVGVSLAVLVAIGCAAPDREASTSEETSTASAMATGAESDQVTPGGTISGTIRERIAVGPYVYLRLETATGELWTAVADAPTPVGDSVTIYNALPMDQFESATLARTFDRIYFGALQPVVSAAHGGSGAMGGAPLVADAVVGRIAPATGQNARTIDAMWLAMDQLAGTTVTVRGVVVKYNGGVMGKNWLHLQDGTGDAAIGTHDLAVTSLDSAAVGDTITVAGTVRTNVDVGAGYRFVLLLEDAKVSGR